MIPFFYYPNKKLHIPLLVAWRWVWVTLEVEVAPGGAALWQRTAVLDLSGGARTTDRQT